MAEVLALVVDGDRVPVEVHVTANALTDRPMVLITIGDKSGNVSAGMSPESALDLADRLKDAAAQIRRDELP